MRNSLSTKRSLIIIIYQYHSHTSWTSYILQLYNLRSKKASLRFPCCWK